MIAEAESGAAMLMRQLYELGMFKTWYRDKADGWTLVSGLWSPVYLQLRGLCSFPETLDLVGSLLADAIEKVVPNASRLVGIAYSGIPIAIATSLRSGIPANMTRKLDARSIDEAEKTLSLYGEHSAVEGELKDHDRVVLIDDLVTRFDSKLVASAQIARDAKARGLSDIVCRDVAVIIDREQGAQEAAAKAGFRLSSLIKLRTEGLTALAPVLAPRELDVIASYFSEPEAFQDRKMQRILESEAQLKQGQG